MTNGFTSPWLQESPKEVDDCTRDGWIQGLVTGSGGCPGRSAFPEGATQKSEDVCFWHGTKAFPHYCSMVCLRLQALPLKMVGQ